MHGSGFAQRMRLASANAVPGAAGIAFLVTGGAPASYALVNLGALLVAVGFIAVGGVRCSARARTALSLGLVAVVALPLVTGPSIDGVTRWIPLGPFTLLSGMLAVPLLVVLSANDSQRGPILLIGAMVAAALQPDGATALALFAAAIALAAATRRPFWIVAAIAGGVAMSAALRTSGPPPQSFVENVVTDVWTIQPLAALALMLALVWPLIVLAKGDERTRLSRLALSAVLMGFVAISFAAPYPVPLIGYGAAPLLGFGLAFAALTRFAARDATGGFSQ